MVGVLLIAERLLRVHGRTCLRVLIISYHIACNLFRRPVVAITSMRTLTWPYFLLSLMRACLLLVSAVVTPAGAVEPLPVVGIVAAENFYGDIAQQIGADRVRVTSILNNPNQDPHLFEASASTARTLSHAQLVIYNGISYDPWLEKMLGAGAGTPRRVLNVAALTQHRPGDNPHLWYDPHTMPALARAVAAELSALDPAHASDFAARLADFLQSMQPLQASVERLRARYSGLPVSATEPVFGYMASALGLSMQHTAFQWAIMNDTEPAASEIIRMEADLRASRVRVLFYNNQASNPATRRMLKIAGEAHLVVVGVSETLPAGRHYQQWMQEQLGVLEHGLGDAR